MGKTLVRRQVLLVMVALSSVFALGACSDHSNSDCQRLRGYYVQDDDGFRDRCIVHDEKTDTIYDAWDKS